MAKGIYVGIDGIAKKAKKAYVSAGGVAKKVKKAYVGVGGVARLCFSYESVIGVYGSQTVNNGRLNFAATTVGDYALFGGGEDETVGKTVEAYNSNLVASSAPNLYTAVRKLTAATVGDRAFFIGGEEVEYSRNYRYAEAYTSELTKTRYSLPSGLSMQEAASTPIGNCIITAGGYGGEMISTTADGVNTRHAKMKDGMLIDLAAATIGNYALFGGGKSNDYMYSTVYAYTPELVKATSPLGFYDKCYGLAATSTEEYALFGGGYSGDVYGNLYTHAYNSELVRSYIEGLSIVSSSNQDWVFPSAASIDGNAVFGGRGNTLVVYTPELIRTTLSIQTKFYGGSAAARIGDYIIFRGGATSINTQYRPTISNGCSDAVTILSMF